MNKNMTILFISVIAISAISFFYIGSIWPTVILSVLFFPVSRKISVILGFFNGMFATSIPFAFYNGAALNIIADFINSTTGLNQVLSLILFPLITGITSMLVALLGSEIWHLTARN